MLGWDGFLRSLAALDSSTLREEFAKADIRHIDSTPQRVHRLTAEAIIAMMAIQRRPRRSGGRPPRRHGTSVFGNSWRGHRTFFPRSGPAGRCRFGAIIPADLQLFDIVIFDEASQIPPAEAIGSLARAPQAVIAGDSHQLPPTSFFGRNSAEEGDDDDGDLSLTSDIESLPSRAHFCATTCCNGTTAPRRPAHRLLQ